MTTGEIKVFNSEDMESVNQYQPRIMAFGFIDGEDPDGRPAVGFNLIFDYVNGIILSPPAMFCLLDSLQEAAKYIERKPEWATDPQIAEAIKMSFEMMHSNGTRQ